MSEWDAFPAVVAPSGWDAFPRADEKPDAVADVGRSRAETVSNLRSIPIAGAWAPKAAAALNAAAQPLTETGLSHAPTFSQRMAENEPRLVAGADQYEEEHPIGSAIGHTVVGGAAMLPAMAAAPEFFGVRAGMGLGRQALSGATSGALVGGADAAARGEDVGKGATIGGLFGAIAPVAGNMVGRGTRAVKNLVSPAPRMPHPTVDLAGVEVPTTEGYNTRDNLHQSEEQRALSGAAGQAPQQIAQAQLERIHGATDQAAEQFGNELRGGPGPVPPGGPADKSVAAGQTITELAQQHNDQLAAQARQEVAQAAHEAQVLAEGSILRHDPAAPLGAPEPAQPHTAADAVSVAQQHIQNAAEAARAGVQRRYDAIGRTAGEYAPPAWQRAAESVRNIIKRANPGQQRVTINPQLTPRAASMLDIIDHSLGNGYYDNALARGDAVQLADGRIVPRPLTPADVEGARKEMVGHLQDARRAAMAPGGSGTDAYAAQRVMDAFDQHHARVLNTPGAFSGDGPSYLRQIEQARAAHAQRRQTFSNQGGGDRVGPVIESIVGRHAGQAMPPGELANALYGSPTTAGGGNSHAILQRALQIVGPNSEGAAALRRGVIPHLIGVPDGAPALSPSQQAARLLKYAQTPHAQTLLGAEGVARVRAHAADLLHQGPIPTPQAARTAAQKAVDKMAAEGTPQHVIDAIFAPSGAVKAGAGAIIQEIRSRVSEPTFNAIRQAMWRHLLEKPEGMRDWGPLQLSNRIATFLDSQAARAMFTDAERAEMRKFQAHYERLAPLPNTFNSSGTQTMAEKFGGKMAHHVGALVGSQIGAHVLGPGVGHIVGSIAGGAASKKADALRIAREVARTQELFLGKKGKHPLSENYSRAAAVISHAAFPAIGQAKGSRQ